MRTTCRVNRIPIRYVKELPSSYTLTCHLNVRRTPHFVRFGYNVRLQIFICCSFYVEPIYVTITILMPATGITRLDFHNCICHGNEPRQQQTSRGAMYQRQLYLTSVRTTATSALRIAHHYGTTAHLVSRIHHAHAPASYRALR